MLKFLGLQCSAALLTIVLQRQSNIDPETAWILFFGLGLLFTNIN